MSEYLKGVAQRLAAQAVEARKKRLTECCCCQCPIHPRSSESTGPCRDSKTVDSVISSSIRIEIPSFSEED